jgi:CubicO group peptidase (beta-lactamase class C family)
LLLASPQVASSSKTETLVGQSGAVATPRLRQICLYVNDYFHCALRKNTTMRDIPLSASELGFSQVGGSVAQGFEPLVEAFAETLALSHDHGGALHIRVAGNVVADLWGGQASISRSWQQDTPSVIFSCTKGLVAILIGELVREGRLDLDAPATTYWPEFAAQGKESIPVRWLLSHRAGLPATRRDLQLADIMDWDRMVQVLADEEPHFPPGVGHRYHALTYGWLAGEIIRRITGMGVEEFFVQRVVRPLKVDAWIGVPKEELPRVAQLHQAPLPPEASPPVVDPEAAALAERVMTLGALPVEIAGPNTGFNSDEIRRAVIPGAGVSRPPKPSQLSGVRPSQTPKASGC